MSSHLVFITSTSEKNTRTENYNNRTNIMTTLANNIVGIIFWVNLGIIGTPTSDSIWLYSSLHSQTISHLFYITCIYVYYIWGLWGLFCLYWCHSLTITRMTELTQKKYKIQKYEWMKHNNFHKSWILPTLLICEELHEAISFWFYLCFSVHRAAATGD